MPTSLNIGVGWILLAFCATSITTAAEPRVLFIRGGDRTGGFLEARSNEQRTEQLADIHNASTARGNHGWAELAAMLRTAGFLPEQITEGSVDQPGPVDLVKQNLSQYAVVVFGSNNAHYDAAQVETFWRYIANGGGALFISDANFGSHWASAPTSDQALLRPAGVIVNQDHGTYALKRADGDFDSPGHPLLNGVGAFDGEGVSPLQIPETAPKGFKVMLVVRAKGKTRDNGTQAEQGGAIRPVTPRDAALLTIEHGKGRVVCHFDRNTFFNKNGAGTDLHRHDNRRFAQNLFRWLAQQ